MSGGGGGQNTITRTELDPTMKPFVQYGLTEAQRLYQQPGTLEYYPGQTFVGPSEQTKTAMAAAQQRAMMGNPLVPAAQQTALQTAQGKFLGPNPYMQAALQPGFEAAGRQYEGSVNQALSNFSRAGRYGSNAMQGALGQAGGEYARALTGQAGALGYQNYADERARQQAILGVTPQLAQADYADIQQLANLGQTAEGYQEMALADAVNRFNFAQQAPYTRLQSFLSAAYGAPSGMQQITPVYRNQFGSAIGGGLAGYALGGAPGAGLGALAGGLLG
jgi:hypothetical protein